MKIFYYTASGNSLAVAKRFPHAQLLSIPQVLKGEETEFSDESIGLIMPCYMANVPPPVEEFIHRIQLRADYLFAVLTYGSISMGTLDRLAAMARKQGITFSYANQICMVDSSIKHFDMDQEVANQHTKEIDRHLAIIVEEIQARTPRPPARSLVKGQLSRLGRHLYRKEIGDVDRKFSVEAQCNGCGTCARVCPRENIRVDGTPRFHHHCIRCYACTHNCPQNAIRLQGEKSRARFRNPAVSLAEIIRANHCPAP